MISTNQQIDTTYVGTANKALNSIDSAQGVITPLVDVYQPIVGLDGSMFDLVNCSKDINLLNLLNFIRIHWEEYEHSLS